MTGEAYIPGDFWRICDECGFKVRASQTRRRWDGAIVCLKDWEARHPQEFVRGRIDRQRVPMPRPEPPSTFMGGETLTADDGITPLQTDSYAEMTVDA